MSNLTKTQILALFLGSASANNYIKELMNGPSSAENVPADQTLTKVHSMTECSANTTCTGADADELCAKFQFAKLKVDDVRPATASINRCIHKFSCGTMGIVTQEDQSGTYGQSFYANCFADPAEGEPAVAPGDVDVNAYLTAIKDLITTVDEDEPSQSVTWGDSQHFWVSPNSRYQDGWYVKDVTEGQANSGKYVETDKPVINECGFNSNCLENECCAIWPDTNNKRCKPKTVNNVEQTVGPLSFTPTCAVDEDVEPDNAIDDLDANALAEASEDLTKFQETLLADAKTAAGYAEMTAEEQAAWDEKRAEIDAARDAFQKELQTAMGYAECDDACKAAFQADLLAWSREKVETCKATPDAIECREADALYKKMVEARVAGDKSWYAMTKEEREEWANNFAATAEKNASALAAAWIKENAPEEGEEGAECSASGAKCGEGQCCGTSTPKGNADGVTDGEMTNVCVTSADKQTGTYTDKLGREYTHVCFAQRLIATAAAAITAFYIM